MQALIRNQTWEAIGFLKGIKPVGYQWVFTVKYKSDGSLERYKARLVATAYIQTYGFDYKKTFALVAKMNMVNLNITSCKS